MDGNLAMVVFGIVVVALVSLGRHTTGHLSRDGMTISTENEGEAPIAS